MGGGAGAVCTDGIVVALGRGEQQAPFSDLALQRPELGGRAVVDQARDLDLVHREDHSRRAALLPERLAEQ